MSKKLKATENLAKDVVIPKPPVNIDKMSVQELKALAYDIIGLLEKNKADLRMVNDQIAKKS